ncbi:hypothetical protein LNP74_27000 [Klebsiella pneumoniae subsp. pneumoniae]|nr:hypothetical protein [Klebsiella pneumoniae subsp. pneumoniae]
MQKVSTGLHGLAAITITVAGSGLAIRPCGKARACRSAAGIIIGGILSGGGSEIGALLMSWRG